MNSSKTANLLMVAHNYESQGRRIMCLKPSLDTRWGENQVAKVGNIQSRALSDGHPCELVDKEENLFKFVKEYNLEIISKYSSGLAAVLVDEAQFLSKLQVSQLAEVAEKLDIAVLCFGLKNSYIKGLLFEGSAALLYYAQSIDEIKTICKYCQTKATMNLRILNGYAIYSGDSDVVIGDVDNPHDGYAQVCYKHYINPPAPIKIHTTKNKKQKINYKEALDYILQLDNEYGFYSKYKKDIEGLDYTTHFFVDNKNDFERLKYLVIGTIMLDLEEFAKKYSNNKKISGVLVNTALFTFLYTIFKDSPEDAYKILKSSSVVGIEFYEDVVQLEQSKLNRTGSSMRRYRVLPNGLEYYSDLTASAYSDFWERLFAGMKDYLNLNVGFYYREKE